ncbi:GroEL-like apical domain [Pseudocohnilembus persalinus]|uniref:GroEL-like apical domain n=1 Tax=Pseudocohnilembus persalinus TaxID=266149 RepID=A0A0V0QDD0_PSEPJ|nr:GroEL-like apical domain [Pseudocohnilembus persalinus]|eukprot:KRX00206.1 GroEL-like apical domain [Pseudocohnilembus persalinus]
MIRQVIPKFKFSESYKTCKVYFGNDARKGILEGIKILNKATQATLGPKGRNVLLEYELGEPRITKDGVTVAKAIMFRDHFQEIGASLIRQASGNTNNFAGDGTTTSTLLTSSIIEEGVKYVQYGANPIDLKRGLDKGRDLVLEYLDEIKQEVDNQDEKTIKYLSDVATNYEPLISNIVADSLAKVGVDGMVEIEAGNSQSTDQFTQGIGLARPCASPEFIVDKSRQMVELSYPLILCANYEIKKIKDIAPILEMAKKQKKQLFIIAQDISKEGNIEMAAMTVPGMGDFSSEIIDDLALITGATVANPKNGISPTQFTLQDLGKAHKVTSSASDTFIFGGEGDKEKLENKKNELKKELSKITKEFRRKIFLDRVGRLSGHQAIVMLGGNNNLEIMETRDKIVDALNAVRLAMKFGYLPGGGTALLRASQILDFGEVDNEDQKMGLQILKHALRQPIEQLQKNYFQNGKMVIQNLLEKYNDNINIGYNLNTDKYEDMVEAGIIDSYPIVKSALIDSISVASMVLTTEVALIKDKYYERNK